MTTVMTLAMAMASGNMFIVMFVKSWYARTGNARGAELPRRYGTSYEPNAYAKTRTDEKSMDGIIMGKRNYQNLCRRFAPKVAACCS